VDLTAVIAIFTNTQLFDDWMEKKNYAGAAWNAHCAAA
jgi:hypothetical protein